MSCINEVYELEKSKEVKYNLDKLYLAKCDGLSYVVYETVYNHKLRYLPLIVLPECSIIDEYINKSFEVVSTFKEGIEEKNIKVCLTSECGKEKKELNLSQIIKIVNMMNLISSSSYQFLNGVCTDLSNKILDLLGINVTTNPNSDLKLIEMEEVVVPAVKVEKLKNLISQYIRVSLLIDEEFTTYNLKDGMDEKISRALKSSKINALEDLSQFSLKYTKDGRLKIVSDNLKDGTIPECKINQSSYQKKIKY